jgi:microcystin-dependent protein
LLCDGTVYDRSQHPGLFGVIGTAYNTGGESSVQFRVPDYRNAVAIGPGDYALGAAGGSKDAALPAHSHTMGTHQHTVNAHSHTTGSHKHTMGTHKHTMTHGHTASESKEGSHAHTSNYAVVASYGGGPLGYGSNTVNGALNVVSTSTPSAANGLHDHTVTVANFTGSSGSTDPGDTNSVNTGNTGETAPRTNSVDPGDTSSKGVAPDGLNYPPFMTANKIIKAV